MAKQTFAGIEEKLKPMDLAPLRGHPLVSVLVANYNYGQYVGAAIESMLRQTYRNFEVIVCDDGSTDDSREVISRYQVRDPRVQLLAKENGGVSSALNAAYAASRGEIICLLDADDLFNAQKLEKVVAAFQTFTRSGVCLNRIVKVDKNDRTFGYPGPVVFAEGWLAAEALRGGGRVRTLPPASAISFRRPVAELLFPVPVHLRRVVDGYLCYTAHFFTEICAVPSVLTRYRFHGENISGMGEFTEVSIRRYVEDLKVVILLMKEFLARHYGNEVAGELSLENNAQYWSFLLALNILAEERPQSVFGEPVEKVVEHIHPIQQRLLGRFLLALPPRVSRSALQWWTGQSPSQAMIVRTARSLLRI